MFCFADADSTVSLLLNMKFQASSLLLRLYRTACVDLVRNPDDQFSRVEDNKLIPKSPKLLPKATKLLHSYDCHMQMSGSYTAAAIILETKQNEPSHEKTNNLDFRPGPSQTGLYSHTRRLEL